MTSDIYEAYIEAYMKTNRCSRDVAIESVKAMLTLIEKEPTDD